MRHADAGTRIRGGSTALGQKSFVQAAPVFSHMYRLTPVLQRL